MRTLLLAGCVLVALSAAAHARTVHGLPDAMLDGWCKQLQEGEAYYTRGNWETCDIGVNVQSNYYRAFSNPELGCVFDKVERISSEVYLTRCAKSRAQYPYLTIFMLLDNQLYLYDIQPISKIQQLTI